jgi:hypothetical protein
LKPYLFTDLRRQDLTTLNLIPRYSWPYAINRNEPEIRRFVDHVSAKGWNLQQVLEKIARKRNEESVENRARATALSQGQDMNIPRVEWDPSEVFCGNCVNGLLTSTGYKWWEEERARAKRELELPSMFLSLSFIHCACANVDRSGDSTSS